MSAAVVNTLHPGQEPNDCAICALACYLDLSYPEVLRAATKLAIHPAEDEGRKGLWASTIRRIARELGTELRVVRAFAPHTAYGIVRNIDHVAVLRGGLVLDRREVMPWVTWRRRHKGHVVLLEAVE